MSDPVLARSGMLAWDQVTADPPPTISWKAWSPNTTYAYIVNQIDPTTFHVEPLDADYPTLAEAQAAVEADYEQRRLQG